MQSQTLNCRGQKIKVVKHQGRRFWHNRQRPRLLWQLRLKWGGGGRPVARLLQIQAQEGGGVFICCYVRWEARLVHVKDALLYYSCYDPLKYCSVFLWDFLLRGSLSPCRDLVKTKTPQRRPSTYCTYSQHSNPLNRKRLEPENANEVILRPGRRFQVCCFLTLENKRRSC